MKKSERKLRPDPEFVAVDSDRFSVEKRQLCAHSQTFGDHGRELNVELRSIIQALLFGFEI